MTLSAPDDTRSSIDAGEIARFEAMAAEWWDPTGKFKPLHKFNPVRLAWIRDRLVAHFGRDADGLRPFEGLRILDIGCGGGLVAEPMARLGADMVAVDASERNVEIARAHARQSGVAVDYRAGTAEGLLAEGERFDVVLSLEVVEHVADPAAFLTACAGLVKPGGVLVVATINRTPRGSHTWSKFVRPSEVAAALRPTGLVLRELAGMSYNPLRDAWSSGKDLGVNYIAFATR